MNDDIRDQRMTTPEHGIYLEFWIPGQDDKFQMSMVHIRQLQLRLSYRFEPLTIITISVMCLAPPHHSDTTVNNSDRMWYCFYSEAPKLMGMKYSPGLKIKTRSNFKSYAINQTFINGALHLA